MDITWADIMTARESLLCNYEIYADIRYTSIDERRDIDAFLEYCDSVPVADSLDHLPSIPVPPQLQRLFVAADIDRHISL